MTGPHDHVHPMTAEHVGGITLREHFAALALASLAPHLSDPAKAAAAAVRMADALVRELNADPAKPSVADDANYIDL